MSQTYYIESVSDTTFEPDNYGNKFYSVRIQGVNGGVLWKTQSKPQPGPQYGHIEQSKSGKASIFKRDKKPDGYIEPQNNNVVPSNIPGTGNSSYNASQPTNAQIMNKLLDIEKLVGKLSVDSETGQLVENDTIIKAQLDNSQLPDDDYDGQPINIADIPF